MSIKGSLLLRLARSLQLTQQVQLRNRLNRHISEGIVEIGKHTYGVPRFHIDEHSRSKIVIGDYCSIAEGVTIFNGSNHNTKWVSTYPMRIMFNMEGKIKDGQPFSKGDVTIGNDVWLATNCTILSGVTIGDGAVVAAGAMVTSNITPYSIVGGSPAKILRKRFSEEAIAKMLEIKWWEWPEQKVKDNVDLLSSENIDAFINKHYPETGL